MTPLYMLALDHRSSFSRGLLGIPGTPTRFEARRAADIKNAAVPGFIGFAVGRTLWWNELVAYVADEITRDEAAARIADNYHRMVEAWARCPQ